MAKRRNLKKEKAQRNQAYARKFRQRKNTGRFSRNRRYGNRPPKDSTGSRTDGTNPEYLEQANAEE
ncbi:MAG: hypothetical protein F6J86_02600 [Symploca sp. SIO1B1]|nr:hypothetical protein [Symploca sp. SIO2D2]NER21259.1 hypothetical protein [Symploca sp. SIO1C2]NER47512.1 hypothetical protein [Symploca sp. SIO1A3]NER92743.1 hypothetical protein [Symploca sp. SIO1B1]